MPHHTQIIRATHTVSLGGSYRFTTRATALTTTVGKLAKSSLGTRITANRVNKRRTYNQKWLARKGESENEAPSLVHRNRVTLRMYRASRSANQNDQHDRED